MSRVQGEVKVIEEILNYLAIFLSVIPAKAGLERNERGDAVENTEPIHFLSC